MFAQFFQSIAGAAGGSGLGAAAANPLGGALPGETISPSQSPLGNTGLGVNLDVQA
jgi:hypothetical protein